MLNIFQEGESTSLLGLSVRANPPGRSHMAIVSRCPRHIENDRVDAASVMTAAAGGLRQRFMRKVAEISHGGKSASDSSGSDSSASDCDGDVERAAKRSKKRTKESRKSSSNSNTSTAVSQADRDIAENKKRGIAQAAKLIQLEQAVPADAQMPPALVEKVSSPFRLECS